MQYIKNALGYSVEIKDHNGASFVFDCERHYSDTGNLYSSGVTALEDSAFKSLKKVRQFNYMLEHGELQITDEKEMYDAANALEEAQEANEKLKAENEELKKIASNVPDAEKMKQLEKENADMKALLEKLGTKEEAKEDKAVKPTKAAKSKEENKDEAGGF